MWALRYWPNRQWTQRYWANDGAALVSSDDGYWPLHYWPMRYWQPNYWHGRARYVQPPEPPVVSERVPYMLMEANGVGRVGM